MGDILWTSIINPSVVPSGFLTLSKAGPDLVGIAWAEVQLSLVSVVRVVRPRVVNVLVPGQSDHVILGDTSYGGDDFLHRVGPLVDVGDVVRL